MTREMVIAKAQEMIKKDMEPETMSAIECMAIENGIFTEDDSFGAGDYSKVEMYWNEVYDGIEF